MLWIIITLLVVVIDQVTKYIMARNIEPGEMVLVFDKVFLSDYS